jgi:single-stranded-DNA-specific exonuclease
MVGISTLSDMVPLIGENRVLARYGLFVIRKSPRPGLRALCAETNIDQRTVTEDDIGFSITPRINAASRMGVPMDAFLLLSATTDAEAILLSKRLERVNKERKTAVATLSKEARKKIKERSNDSVIVMGDMSWRPSLLGLVANKLASEFKKPAFLWGVDGDGVIKGSCRGGGGKSVLEVMKGAKEGSFLAFGGHKASGGFEVSFDAIHSLAEALHLSGLTVLGNGTNDECMADMSLSLTDVHKKTVELLSKMSPFGVGNARPVFVFENVVPAVVAKFGKESNHLKISFRHETGRVVDAIAFFVDDLNLKATPFAGKLMHLVGTIEESSFMGRREIRIRIIDVLEV